MWQPTKPTPNRTSGNCTACRLLGVALLLFVSFCLTSYSPPKKLLQTTKHLFGDVTVDNEIVEQLEIKGVDEETSEAAQAHVDPIEQQLLNQKVPQSSQMHQLAQSEADRLRLHPFKHPIYQDSGTDLLPFNESMVHPNFRSTSRLDLEVRYHRLKDVFGLIDTTWTDDQILETMQGVVDIWAQANIRVRVHAKEALDYVDIGLGRALGYLYYVNWPAKMPRLEKDIAKAMKKNKPHPMRDEMAKRASFKAFFKNQCKAVPETSGAPSFFERIEELGVLDHSEPKRQRNSLIDYVVGWPGTLSPWHVTSVTNVFPMQYYYFMNGGGGSGFVRIRSRSCARNPRTVDGRFDVKCYRFFRGPWGKEASVVRPWESRDLTPKMAARLIAHEIGHALGLKHVDMSCKTYPTWEQGELMMQVRSVTVKGKSCKLLGHPEHHLAAALSAEEIEKARFFVAKKQLRATTTLPGCVTVGNSTDQMSTSTPEAFYPGENPSRNGWPISECSANMGVVVFNQLPSPATGQVLRVRWRGTKTVPKQLRVLVLEPQHHEVQDPDGKMFYSIRSFSEPLDLGTEATASPQVSHREVDVNLQIHQGDVIALAVVSDVATSLAIEQRRYLHDKVKYGDAIQKVGYSAKPQVAEKMFRYDPQFAYPNVLVAQRHRDAFHYTSESLNPVDLQVDNTIETHNQRGEDDELCADLIANYDVMAFEDAGF